ncbi:MAG: FecR domain-containing protein [Chloroflexi bacterium]|nr:FecR domain-containing protein [Chloroflexota bacterium]
MTQALKRVLFTILVLSMILAACGQKPAGDTAQRPPLTASLSEIQGLVEAKQAGEDAFTQVAEGFVLQVKSQIQTGADGKVRLDISDGTILRLGPSTAFTFNGEEETSAGFLTKVQVQAGQLFIILSGGALEVDTPAGVASVRGSYMEVRIDEATGQIIITCLEGDCSAETEGGTVSFSAGQTAVINSEDLPPELRDMTPEEVLNWLQNNPEATVVIVPLTATVAARATDTPEEPEEPTSTFTPVSSATNTPIPPTDTPENPQVTLNKDALCMTGPGSSGYVVVGTVFAGQTANVVGQTSTHWVIEMPGKPGVICWIPKSSGDANDSASGVRIFLPPPTITPTPKPTKEKPTDTPEKDEPTKTPCPTYQEFSYYDPCYTQYYYPTGTYVGFVEYRPLRAMHDTAGLNAKQ